MKTISVGQLRQNPTRALTEVEHGEVYAVTRNNREIAHLIPPRPAGQASPEEAMAVYGHSPLPDHTWAHDLLESRSTAIARPE